MTFQGTPKFEKLAGRSAAEFVLHRSPMLLLDRLEEISLEHAICSWKVPPTASPFASDKGIPGYIAIECMAQCIAVHAGALASLEGRGPPLGLLLGTRHFKAARQYLEVGVDYKVTCRELVRDSQGLASFDCTIVTRNSSFAACRLAVFERQGGLNLDELTK